MTPLDFGARERRLFGFRGLQHANTSRLTAIAI
jgi:hypothetical protein